MAAIKKYDPFLASQKLWLIDSNNIEVDKISSNLSPDVQTFKDIDSFVDTFTARLRNDDSFATIIIADNNLPSGFRDKWQTLVEMINSVIEDDKFKNRLFIFEINDKSNGVHVFNNSVLSDSVDDFLQKAHNVHFESITSDETVDDEAKNIITQLRIKNDKYSSDIKNNKKIIEENKETIKNLRDQSELLQQQIESYKQQAKNGDDKAREAQELISQNEIKMKSFQTQIDNLNKESNDLKATNADLLTKLNAEREASKKRNKELAVVSLERDRAKADLEKEREWQEKYNNAKNEFEENKIIRENINAQKAKADELQKQLVNAQQEKSVVEIQLEEAKKEAENIRKGYTTVNRIGYSNNFSIMELKNTDVMYFKVIDPLPYHRYYLNKMIEMMRMMFNDDSLQQDKPSDFIKLVYHKIDFGNDNKIIGEYPQIGGLNAINEFSDHYRLIPSISTKDNVNKFEEKKHILIFVDYISDSKYYIKTNGDIDYFSITKHSELAKELNLYGNNISYDENSVLDLRYDSSFNKLTKDNKEMTVFDRISSLISHSNVIKKYIQ